MSHSIQAIPVVESYFGAGVVPVIVQAFHPDRGWQRYPFAKRVSRSWLRKMHAEGFTSVALSLGIGRTQVADFTIRELLAPLKIGY